MSDNKYKMFRNFMVNELGITKDDIMEWTKQAVSETVEKELRKILPDAIRHKIGIEVMSAATPSKVNTIMREIMAEEVTKDLVAKVKRNLDKIDKMELED